MSQEEALINIDIYKKLLADYINLQSEINELKKQLAIINKYQNQKQAEKQLTQNEQIVTAAQWFKIGNAYFEKNEYDKALVAYDQTIILDPQHVSAYYNRGNSYDKKERYEHAIADYEKAIALSPENATIYYARGNTYNNKGDYERAISDFDRAIALNPGQATTYFNKGLACERAGHMDAGIDAYRQFILYTPPEYTEQIEYAKKRIADCAYKHSP